MNLTFARSYQFSSPFQRLLGLAVFLFLLGFFFSPLAAHAQDESSKSTENRTETMESMDEKSMRMVSGREGLTFDTITVDGKLDEQISSAQDNNDFGLLIGPIVFNEVVIGQSRMVTPAVDDSRFSDSDESFSVDVGPVRGGFMSELSLGLIGGPSNGMGGFGAGGMKMNNVRVDVNTQ
jgi:hypothetical protein